MLITSWLGWRVLLNPMAQPPSAAPGGQVVAQLLRALSVAYRDHQMDFVESEKWALRIHRDDLLDMLGNVLENACKYGAGRVRVTTRPAAGTREVCP